MKKLTTLQQSKIMYTIQIGIIIWCISIFIKNITIFKLWFSVLSLGVFGFTLIQLCCRLKEVMSIKDLEKED